MMEFETKRCRIREFNLCDIDKFMEYRNNDEWMRFQGFKNLSREHYIKTLITDNPCQFAVIKKNSNEIIGDIYLEKEGENCNIGYTINPKCSRQGYAYEVVLGLIKSLDCKVIKACVDSNNIASIKLLEKLDFNFVSCCANEETWEYLK